MRRRFLIQAVVLVLLILGMTAQAKEDSGVKNDLERTELKKNHLAQETSPYLLQHVHNPVDWYPWGEEALAKAKAEEKPIFLSIGYSACHWCHVMERESFENEGIAALLNTHFVSIKVDREERPDIDEIYMAAVMAMTGSGGWPMSVFLTPDLQPFYGGTYFPPEDKYGRPGFNSVLSGVAEVWSSRRDEVLQSAEQLTAHIREAMVGNSASAQQIKATLFQHAIRQLRTSFDEAEGGWGGAPKFPSSGSIMLLLRQYHQTGDPELLRMVTVTLEKMALGGIYDHLGGGFHRYAVDAQWLVPHFEKMLYDNAQLAQVYTEAYQVSGDPFFQRIACETLDYLLRDMRDAKGAFHSSEDADSEGEEGKFYLWTPDEIEAILGAEDGAYFSKIHQVRAGGNFDSHESYHAGQSILHRAEKGPELDSERLRALREKLREAREARVRPGRDDKVLTSWNALAISAFAQASRVFQDPRYAKAATEAGYFLCETMLEGKVLLRTHRQGESRLPGYLDDYAFSLNAFVDLYEATFDGFWLDTAAQLAEVLLTEFWDEQRASFFFSSSAHKHLLVRSSSAQDGAEPSGNAIAALGLQRLARLMDKARYQEVAEKVIEGHAEPMQQHPLAYLRMLCAADFMISPSLEIVLVGDVDAADFKALLEVIYSRFLPNRVVLAKAAESEGAQLPLLKNRRMVDGKATAYLCRNKVCGLPITTPEALGKALGE